MTPSDQPEQANFQGKFAGQALTITTREVIPLLLILLVTVGGYLAWQAQDRRMELMQSHHVRLFDMLLQQNKDRIEDMDHLRRLLVTMDYNLNRPVGSRVPLELTPIPSKE